MRRSHNVTVTTAFLLILGGVTVPMLAVEVGMRLYHRYVKEHSSYKAHENSAIVFVRKGNANHEINSLGFRDRERSFNKKSNAFRIVVLGDSVTNGYKVEFKNRFTNKLEVLLNKHSQGGRPDIRFKVVNMGTNQYSTVQEVAIFEEIGRKLDPDLVVLVYVLNDATADGSLNEFFRKDRSVSLLMAWLQRIREEIFGSSKAFESVPNCSFFDYYSRMHCDAAKWSAVVDSLKALGELSVTDGFISLLVVVPLLDNEMESSFDKYRWSHIHARLESVGESLGFEVLDLIPYFRGHAPADLKVSKDDKLHPNALGNEIIAQALARKLKALGIAAN